MFVEYDSEETACSVVRRVTQRGGRSLQKGQTWRIHLREKVAQRYGVTSEVPGDEAVAEEAEQLVRECMKTVEENADSRSWSYKTLLKGLDPGSPVKEALSAVAVRWLAAAVRGDWTLVTPAYIVDLVNKWKLGKTWHEGWTKGESDKGPSSRGKSRGREEWYEDTRGREQSRSDWKGQGRGRSESAGSTRPVTPERRPSQGKGPTTPRVPPTKEQIKGEERKRQRQNLKRKVVQQVYQYR